ncbi:MAG: PKD domain-containing protein [Candidatus Binatia bacterium]|nr:PKD domain-containing protein [Candidatus Binatia bacterium]
MSKPTHRLLLSWLLVPVVLASVAAHAATFYVSPDGSDDGAGNAQAPWRTVQTAVNRLLPGDSLIVRPGVYREAVIIAVGGTANAPIWLKAEPGVVLESPDPTGSLSAWDFRPTAAYIIVEGFEIRGGYHESVFVRPGAHDLALRRLSIHGNRSGVWIAGAANIELSASTIEANTSTGVRIYQGSQNISIMDTWAVGNDDGRGCEGDADGFAVDQDVTGFQCIRCRASWNGEDGFDIEASNVRLDQSWAIGNGCAGLKLFQGGRVTNSVFARNRTGLLTTNFNPTSVVAELDHLTVADNSGVGLLLRAPMVSFTQAPYAVQLTNSVVAGGGKAVEIEPNVSFVERRNILFRSQSNEPVVVLHQETGTTTFTGQEINSRRYASQTGLGEGTLAVDPEFAEHNEYTLLDMSPAVDRAAPNSEGSLDAGGRARPVGHASDIGAHESPFALSNHLPWPDPGPARRVIAGTWLRVTAYGSVDPDGDPLFLSWNFGDGSAPAAGFSARHLYLEPGGYTLELLASDGRAQRSRSAPVTVEWPPATHSQHDTAINPISPIKVVIPRGKTETYRTLRVRVRNADALSGDEPYGHLVQVIASDGTCPTGTIIESPDFEPNLAGPQARALIPTGRTRTARLRLRLQRSTVPGCELQLEATTVFPGNIDPTTGDNQARVGLRVIDRNAPQD